MGVAFEDLRILKMSETFCDEIWSLVSTWKSFEKNTMGKQIVRSADSIGANIAEAYGRYHFADKLNFMIYARGSLFETKYWLNRAQSRHLISPSQADALISQLNQLGKSLNNLIRTTRAQKNQSSKRQVREPFEPYAIQPSSFNEL